MALQLCHDAMLLDAVLAPSAQLPEPEQVEHVRARHLPCGVEAAGPEIGVRDTVYEVGILPLHSTDVDPVDQLLPIVLLRAGGHQDDIVPCAVLSIGTGAGDAMTAALLFGLLNDIELDDAIRLGVSAASLTLRHPGSVYPELSLEGLYDQLLV